MHSGLEYIKKMSSQKMSFIIAFSSLILLPSNVLKAQSSILENIKRNPEEAQSLCSQFRELNSRGISASSTESLKIISEKKNLDQTSAEILSMYVRGLHCPDVV